jgi:hypothetical protein
MHTTLLIARFHSNIDLVCYVCMIVKNYQNFRFKLYYILKNQLLAIYSSLELFTWFQLELYKHIVPIGGRGAGLVLHVGVKARRSVQKIHCCTV